MPVSRPKMMISERTTSMRSSDTGHQLGFTHDRGKFRVLGRKTRADRFDVVGWQRHAKSTGQLGHDAPIGAGKRRWRRATLLVLNYADQVRHAGLALVRVGHRQ